MTAQRVNTTPCSCGRLPVVERMDWHPSYRAYCVCDCEDLCSGSDPADAIAEWNERQEAFMTPAKPCPACGRKPECHASYVVSCHCPNCYDGTEDAPSSAQLCGWGETANQAVEDWNQRVTDLEEETA